MVKESTVGGKHRARTSQDEASLWGQMNRFTPMGVAVTRLECRHPIGMPDVMFWTPSRGHSTVGFVELKDNDPEIRPQQRITGIKGRRAGQTFSILLRTGDREGTLALYDPRRVPVDCSLRGLTPEFKAEIADLGTVEAWGQIWDYLIELTKGKAL